MDAFSCAYLPHGAINKTGFNAGLCWIKKAEKLKSTIGPYHENIEYVFILFLSSHLILLLKRMLVTFIFPVRGNETIYKVYM